MVDRMERSTSRRCLMHAMYVCMQRVVGRRLRTCTGRKDARERWPWTRSDNNGRRRAAGRAHRTRRRIDVTDPALYGGTTYPAGSVRAARALLPQLAARPRQLSYYPWRVLAAGSLIGVRALRPSGHGPRSRLPVVSRPSGPPRQDTTSEPNVPAHRSSGQLAQVACLLSSTRCSRVPFLPTPGTLTDERPTSSARQRHVLSGVRWPHMSTRERRRHGLAASRAKQAGRRTKSLPLPLRAASQRIRAGKAASTGASGVGRWWLGSWPPGCVPSAPARPSGGGGSPGARGNGTKRACAGAP